MKYWITIITLVFLSMSVDAAGTKEVKELEWDAMIPDDYRPDKIMNQFGDISELEDDDPRTQEILEELEKAWSAAPVVEALDGKRVKLPGFVVPLEGDGKKLSEFLLVPYVGACIHMPPPIPSQIISATSEEGFVSEALYTPVWVTGVLSTKSGEFNLEFVDGSENVTVSYSLAVDKIEPITPGGYK